MSKYQTFVFKDYIFDKDSKTLTLRYGYDDKLSFSEKYTFDFDFVDDLPNAALHAAFKQLFIMAGVSYYKMYLAPVIETQNHAVDDYEAGFFSKTYQRGLGEFFYINKLDPKTAINFPASTSSAKLLGYTPNEGLLIGVGGGKDSLVSIEILRDQPKVAT